MISPADAEEKLAGGLTGFPVQLDAIVRPEQKIGCAGQPAEAARDGACMADLL